MKTLITAIAIAIAALAGPALAASEKAACEAQAAEKKLSGAAKNSFVKKCDKDAKSAATATCESQAKENTSIFQYFIATTEINEFTNSCQKPLANFRIGDVG